MPNLQPFDPGHGIPSRSHEPTVTIQPRGLIGFSRAAMEALGQPEAVTFLVDKDERLLGFRAAQAEQWQRRATGNGAVIRNPGRVASAAPVLRYLGADLSRSRRYPLALVDGVHCVDLKQPGVLVTGNRQQGN